MSISPLDAASERLAVSFSALERVIASATASATERQIAPGAEEQEALIAQATEKWVQQCDALETDLNNIQQENKLLQEDNQRLSQQLEELHNAYMELQELTEDVADQIDNKVQQLELIAQ